MILLVRQLKIHHDFLNLELLRDRAIPRCLVQGCVAYSEDCDRAILSRLG
jgi:hypothetical protein